MTDEGLARLKWVASNSWAPTFNKAEVLALIAEVERLRVIEARMLDFQRKCCPHGFRYHAECPECCE